MKLVKATMQAMKAMKAMKAPYTGRRQRRNGDDNILRELVWENEISWTRSGKEKDDFVKHNGKIKLKKQVEHGRNCPWIAAVAAARQAMNMKGFGAATKGARLYKKAKELLAKPQ